MRCFLRLFIIILVVVHSPEFAAADEKDILSQEERQWLITHDGKIRYAPLPNYPPIEFVDSEGTHQGVTADYLRRIEQELDFGFAKVQANSWNEIIEKAKQGEIDVIGSIHNTPERREYLMFTKPYLEIPNVIIVREEYHRPLTLEEMGGMKVVIVKGYASFGFIKNNYPNLFIEPVTDDLTGLQTVSFGRADAIITDLSVASYLIEQMKISNLRVAGTIDYAWKITFASRKDWPILNNILEKGLAAIDQKERQAIYSKWVPYGYEDLFPRKKLLRYIAIILSITGGGIVLIFTWNRMLKRQIIQKTAQLHKELEERKQADEALKESEERFRAMFDNAIDGILLADTEEKRFHTGNKSICQMLGYTLEEIKNMGVMDTHPKEDLPYVIEQFEKQSMKEIALAKDIPVLRKDGTIFYADINSSVVSLAGKTYLLGIFRDITERKQMEKTLLESEERYRTLIEMSPTAILVLQEGKTVFCNPEAVKVFGATRPAELIGKSVFDLVHPDYHEIVKKRAEQLKKDKKPLTPMEQKYIGIDGRVIDVEATATLINYMGKPSFLSVFRDITEHKRAVEEREKLQEQLLQSRKMEAIGRLAGGIAHDFNNILTAIIGNADLALMSVGKDDTLREEIEEIRIAGKRAAALTRQLLAFSRKQIIQPKILDLNELLTDLEKMLGRLIGEDVEMLIIPDLALWQVEMDPGQMEQVIMNLVINAKDSMPKGGKLTIEVANVDLDRSYFRKRGIKNEQPGAYVMLAVSDTGIGMDKETQERIFEPFFTTKEIGKGTGMGLSTVYGIVNQNNGFIWAYSELGQGSTFKIYLPKAEGDAASGEKEQYPVTALGGSETVLIVEDDDSLRKLARTVLEQRGYKVLEAENGEDALRVSEAHDGSIDLLITDVVMPKMGGKEVVKRLQPLYPHMKVIYMSGYTDNTIVHHSVLAPGLNFFEKPFSPDVLLRKVRGVLDKKQG